MNKPKRVITVDGYEYVLRGSKEEVITYHHVLGWYECQDWTPDVSSINQLAITAKYLNGDWVKEPHESGWVLRLTRDGAIDANFRFHYEGTVFFKDEATAMKAVEILGEDVVKDALMFGSI